MSTIINKIEKILTSQYSTQNYVELMQEIFDSLKIVAPNIFHEERSNFSSHILGYTHIGNYITPEEKKIAVFAVQLKKENYVENSRSTQRSYAKKLIESGNCDAAIVAFFTEGEPKWRLSFIRLDYEMKIEHGKLKTTENITPAKRYSFLVGKDEPSHTAIERFRQFIIDSNSNPSLDEIEEAFSVEKVTKEFFELYCEKFYQLQEYLESNEDFIEESKRCGFTSEQYAKKLMGQIVFLYFLQKKGWLGVKVWIPTLTEKEFKNIYYVGGAQGRIIKEHLTKIYIAQPDGTYRLNSRALDMISDDEEEVIANHMLRKQTWGDGSKKFLRTIFEFSKNHKGHFFENYLEPLFYDTLNKNRGAMGYCPALHCRIPFLSGGFFEPLDGYDWKSNYFDIPDEIFSNKSDENDRNADGILDIFDRYNFTMSEDEPMEREVAIDPEMLGKIFENLLDIKDRKSKGAFYTPREIVHYMCGESLINYLVRKTQISEDAVRDFILYGDFMKDEDTVKSKREGNGGMYISDEIFKINEEGNIAVNRLKDIDDALASVRVADPAVGSGAFPLGMVNEIVRARENITAYMTIGMNANTKRLLYKNERSPYRLKKDTIKNSIFAVDIEPSAVDITQLRLWLSLVIDDEITPDAANELEGHRDPLPLPNLECNIICGNSLVDEFMGIKLVNESDILHNTKINSQIAVGQSEFEAVLQKLLQAQDELFLCDDPNNKIRLKEYIQSYKDLIINNQMKNCSDEIQEAYKAACISASKPFVLWELDFARVFRDNGGFDIVIGNPPYVDSETMTKYMPEQRAFYTQRFVSCKGNWDLFIPFVELGYLLSTDIGSVSYIIPNKIIAADYAKACRKMMSEYSIKEIRDYSSVRVFLEAAVYPITFLADKSKNCNTVKMVVMNNLTEIGWYNEIGNEDIFATDKWDSFFAENTRVYTLIKEIINKSTPLSEIAEVKGAATVSEAYEIKNILTDSEEYDSNMHFKFVNTGTIDPYISLWESAKTQYIKQGYYKPIVKKDKLKELYPRRYDDASKEKIIIGGMTKELECYYDSGETLAGKSTTIVLNSKVDVVYLTGLLNSKLMTQFYRNYFNSLSLAGGFYRVGAPQIKQLPIIVGTEEQQKKLIEITTRMIKKPNDTDRELIDKMVFEIYKISEDDIIVLTEPLK